MMSEQLENPIEKSYKGENQYPQHTNT